MLHRAGLADDFDALCAKLVADAVDIVDAERDVAEAAADVVALRVPVVRQLEYGVLGLVTVADEGQREASRRIVLPPEQSHAERLAVEGERALEVPDAQHGVEHPHAQTLARAAYRLHRVSHAAA